MYCSTFPNHRHIDRYLRDGCIMDEHETTRDMISRVVDTLAATDARFDPAGAEQFAERLGWALDTERVVFSTPIMTNAGRYADRPLAACAVPPVDLRGDLAQVKAVVDEYHRAGMGTGFSLDDVNDPVAVLRYLNDVAIAGAESGTEDRPVGNMAILSLNHPLAEEFIQCKVGADMRGETWKFNISLHVTDDEMHAALYTPSRERELLIAAAEAARVCADPGLLFSDRMSEGNPTQQVGEYVSTAPCAEVGLVTGETCQFGYVNLGRFCTPRRGLPVDTGALADTVRLLVRALDDAIEASLDHYPSPVSRAVMGAKRKIGVGVCGLADLLVAARLPYDSPEARSLAQEVLSLINYTSKVASLELALQRGACPAVRDGHSRYADTAFVKRFAALDVESVSPTDWASLAAEIARTGNLRNSSTVAVPPTGRSAPVVGASTGIEPLFRLTDELTGRLRHGVVAVLREVGCEDLVDVLTVRGQLPDVDTVPASLRSVLATATQISPHGQLAMAAAVQACVDEAVSKTVNLPAAARSIDVYDTFATAWEMGCKGITVYVDGSRQTQPQAL